MLQLVNWEYYNSLFRDISENDFERYEHLAENEIKSIIGPIRWACITENTFGYETLKDCICIIMNELYNADNDAGVAGIASVSNDGYTENYVTKSINELRNDRKKSIKQLLSGTGLVGAY